METRIKSSRLPRKLIWGSIFVFLLGTVSVPEATASNTSGEMTISRKTLVTLAFPFLAYFLAPVPKWEKEIKKLQGDELFVQRWMLLNNDDASLAKGKRALEKIQTQKTRLEKKRNRFMKFFHPAVAIGSICLGYLTFFLTGGDS